MSPRKRRYRHPQNASEDHPKRKHFRSTHEDPTTLLPHKPSPPSPPPLIETKPIVASDTFWVQPALLTPVREEPENGCPRLRKEH